MSKDKVTKSMVCHARHLGLFSSGLKEPLVYRVEEDRLGEAKNGGGRKTS